jgi:16S rRNA (uracil1498-N3)-methyltransferase
VRLTRVYVDAPLTPGERVALAGSAATHITRVLRLGARDPLTLFNGQGGEYAARIAEARGGRLTVVVGEAQPIERESALGLTLAQGVSRGERMDLVVQKATELGVGGIAPLFTERSVVRLSGPQAARKLEHWRAIAVSACEQSGRNRLPQVSAPVPLADFLQAPVSGTRLLLSPGGAVRIQDLPRPVAAVTVLIGPEGGLTEAERAAAVAAGFTPVRLGPRVLRTETAALAALSVLQSAFGDL